MPDTTTLESGYYALSWGDGVSASVSIPQGGAVDFILNVDGDSHSVVCTDASDNVIGASHTLSLGQSFQVVFPVDASEQVYLCADTVSTSADAAIAVVVVG